LVLLFNRVSSQARKPETRSTVYGFQTRRWAKLDDRSWAKSEYRNQLVRCGSKNHKLFILQGDQGIDFHGAAGGNVAGRQRDEDATAMPTSTPTKARTIPCRAMRRCRFAGCAPSAIRMPISRVRLPGSRADSWEHANRLLCHLAADHS